VHEDGTRFSEAHRGTFRLGDAGRPAVFELTFENGLTPEVGPQEAGKWSGKAPPQYYPIGLSGQALILGDLDNTAQETQGTVPTVTYARPPGMEASGTLLFWMRGLENWDLNQTVFNDPTLPSTDFVGWGGTSEFRLLKSGMDTGGPKLFMGYGHPNRHKQITYRYMPLNHYRWFQLGVSWEDDVVRLYQNGSLVNEQRGWKNWIPILARRFHLGGGYARRGGRRLMDNVKLWDRALTVSEVKRVYRQDLRLANKPLVSAGRLPAPPRLDGRIEPDEWTAAAVITGMLETKSGEMAADQSAFYLGYDADYLYVGMQGELTEQARERPAEVVHRFVRLEGDLEADDAMEVILSPDYWRADLEELGYWKEYGIRNYPGRFKTYFQTNRLGRWTEYRLVANAGEARDDAGYGPGGAHPDWDAGWDTASSLGTEGWQLEARIPLEAFERVPVPGEEWGLQLSRLWKQLKQQDDVWSWGIRVIDRAEPPSPHAPPEYPAPDGVEKGMYLEQDVGADRASLGVLRFARIEEPVIRLRRTGSLGTHEVRWRAVLQNPAEREQEVEVRLFSDTQELNHEERLTLPAGQAVEFARDHDITDYATSRVTFEVRDTAGTLLHRTEVPFYLEQIFSARVVSLPYDGKFLVELGLGALSQTPLEELRVDLAVSDGSNRTVYTLQDRGVNARTAVIEGDAAGLEPGEYDLAVAIRRGSEVVARRKLDLLISGKAPWHDNKLGYEDIQEDKAPYPWTDMAVTEETIRVWGREYRFGNRILPEQIRTLGRDMLRAPMRLVLETGEGEVFDFSTVKCENEWSKRSHVRVEGRRRVERDAFSVTNAFWAEYDGLIWCTLTLTPKETVRGSLVIELPLNGMFSDVIKAGGHRDTGALGPEGFAGEGSVWLGNGDGGIQVLPSGGRMRVEKKNGAATLRYVVAEGAEFSGPFAFTLGFAATPMRPKTWRTPEYPHYRGKGAGNGGGGAWYPPGYDFKPAADRGSGFGAPLYCPYVFTSQVNTMDDASGIEEYRRYGAEWTADPFVQPQDGGVHPSFNLKPLRDYFVWRYWRYREKYGFKGLYFDNPGDGALLNLRDLVKRLYNIALRNKDFPPRDMDIGIASNGAYNMAFGAFFIYQWNGENLNSVVLRGSHYLNVLNPAVFRAEYMGHNFGWPVRFLGQGRITREAVEAAGGIEVADGHFMGLSFLHDTLNNLSSWNFMPSGLWPEPYHTVMRRTVDAMDRHDFSHWATQFVPYWSQEIVPLPAEHLYASLYIARPSRLLSAIEAGNDRAIADYFDHNLPDRIRRSICRDVRDAEDALSKMKDKVILIVYNDSEWEGTLRLKPDWAKIDLGAPEDLKVENAVHRRGFRLETGKNEKGEDVEQGVFFDRPEEEAKIEAGELVFPITKWSYRMIVVSR